MRTQQVISEHRIATACPIAGERTLRPRGVPVTVRRNFALNLKAWMKVRGLTQQVLAEQIGVTQKAVSRWAQQVDWPDSRNIDKIVKALKVDYSELFRTPDDVETPPPEHEVTMVLTGAPAKIAASLTELQAKWGPKI